MSRHTRLTAALVVTSSGLLAGAQLPVPRPAFKAGVNLVEVDARVLDSRGQFVTGLSQDDFRIFEDGREQSITQFSLVDIGPAGTSASATLARIRANDSGGRTYVILIDDMNIHPMRADSARRIARQFVMERLAPGDQAAVTVTSGGRGYQDLTGNRRALLTAIDRILGRGLESGARDAFVGGASEAKVRPIDTADALKAKGLDRELPTARGTDRTAVLDEIDIRERNASVMLRAVRDLAVMLPNLDGRRKALVVISEGFSLNPDAFNTHLQRETVDTIAAAVKNNVALYPISPRGLITGRPATVRPILLGDEAAFDPLQRIAHQGLHALAAETGGVALYDTNDPASVFDRIVNDSSRYYLLGYHGAGVTNTTRTFHRIEIRVNRPDVSVTARPGYFTSPVASSK